MRLMIHWRERISSEQGHKATFATLPRLLLVVAGWLCGPDLAVGQPADGTMGRVEGGEVLSLGTSATGTIAEMPVSAGDRVKAVSGWCRSSAARSSATWRRASPTLRRL